MVRSTTPHSQLCYTLCYTELSCVVDYTHFTHHHIGPKYFIQFPLLWRKVSSSPLLLSSVYTLKFAAQVRTLLSRPMPCTDPLPSALAIHFAHAVQA